MKYFKRIISIIVLFMIVSVVPHFVMAHGFETENVSDEQFEKILKNIELELFEKEKECASIECFDVNEDRQFAIGFNAGNKRIVQIYDKDRVFQRGFSFSYGGHYSVKLTDDNLEIYLARSDVIIVINSSGVCVSIENVPLNSPNRLIADAVLYETEKSVGEYTYYLDRDHGITIRDYASLICVDDTGNKSILFDVTPAHNTHILLTALLVIAFVFVWLIGMKNQIIGYLNKKAKDLQ